MNEKLSTTEPMMLLNVRQTYQNSFEGLQLYGIASKAWRTGSRRFGARYAVPFFDGITLEVYEILHWYRIPPDKSGYKTERWGFCGQVASEELRVQMKGKSVSHIIGNSSYPVRYVNC